MFRRNGQNGCGNSFYMELMGDYLSSPPDTGSREGAGPRALNDLDSINASYQETKKVDGQVLSDTHGIINRDVDELNTNNYCADQMHKQISDRHLKNGNSFSLHDLNNGDHSTEKDIQSNFYTTKDANDERRGSLVEIPENSGLPAECRFVADRYCQGQSYPNDTTSFLQRKAIISPKTDRETNSSYDSQHRPEPRGKDNGSGGHNDNIRQVHNLSIIMEETEDSSAEESSAREQPRSHLLPTNSLKSEPRLGDLQEVDATEQTKVITLTVPESHDIKDAFTAGPLFPLRAKMTRKQTIQVAGLMAVGFVFICAILTWVFSPVIFGI